MDEDWDPACDLPASPGRRLSISEDTTDYSSGEDDSAEEDHQGASNLKGLARKEQELLEYLTEETVAAVYEQIVRIVSSVPHSCCGTSGKQTTQMTSRHDGAGTADCPPPPPPSNKKRHRKERSSGEESHSDDESGRDDKDKKRSKPSIPAKQERWACPFFKHNPIIYGKIRTCCGPGFSSIRRMK